LKLTLCTVGDAFVRELEFSKITLRIVEKLNAKDDDEHIVAKLTGDTYSTLQRILVCYIALFLWVT
jgi:Ca2+-dependent lipid-binding protein